MMRIAVTGAKGQVATSLVERAGPEFEIVTLSRPAFSLEDRDAVLAGIEAARPDAIVNAAAYTAVDQGRVGGRSRDAGQRRGGWSRGGSRRENRRALAASLDRLCVRRRARPSLPRRRPDRPDRRLRPLETRRRKARRRALSQQRNPAHRVGLQPVRREFRPHDAAAQRNARGGRRRRRSARQSDLGARHRRRVARRSQGDCASNSSAGAARRLPYHRSGEATWADFAEAVFQEAQARGRRLTRVKRITTADYPTPARRPANSRLDNEKLRRVYGLVLPDWRTSLAACCARLIP